MLRQVSGPLGTLVGVTWEFDLPIKEEFADEPVEKPAVIGIVVERILVWISIDERPANRVLLFSSLKLYAVDTDPSPATV